MKKLQGELSQSIQGVLRGMGYTSGMHSTGEIQKKFYINIGSKKVHFKFIVCERFYLDFCYKATIKLY